MDFPCLVTRFPSPLPLLLDLSTTFSFVGAPSKFFRGAGPTVSLLTQHTLSQGKPLRPSLGGTGPGLCQACAPAEPRQKKIDSVAFSRTARCRPTRLTSVFTRARAFSPLVPDQIESNRRKATSHRPRHKVTPGVIWTSAPEPHLRGSVAADAHTNQVTFPSKHRGGLFPPRLSPDWLHSSPCYELS